jgi:hypothetical protein
VSKKFWIWSGVLSAAAAVVVGCESVAERSIVPAPAGSLTLLFSADNQGVLSSCGCPTNPSGGFAKRQTIVDKFRRVRPDVLVVDAGDMFPDRPNPMKVKYLAVALGRAKYDAVAAGDQEFGLGVALMQALAGEHKLPLICANVCDEAGKPVFPPHVIREAGGRRIGIFAVIADQAYGTPPREWRKGLKVEPPIEAAKREVRDLAGCDLIVALSHQPMSATQELAKSVPGIHVVVSGHDDAVLRKPLSAGGALIVGTGPVGRIIGCLTFSRAADGTPATAMELIGLSERTVRDIPWVMDLYWEYVKKAKGEPPPDWALGVQPPVYEGAEDCAKCHEKEYKQWQGTRHASAYASIKRKGKQDDPECILCHTMGYGREGGFWSIAETPDLGRITCQACHPVAANHHDKNIATNPREIDSRVCIHCHSLVESPDFDFATYKPKIVHGPRATGKPATESAGTP